MLALTKKGRAVCAGGRGDAATAFAHSDGLVLPRFARRPVRLAQRLWRGDVRFHKHAFAFLATGFLGATVLYGSVLGGQAVTVIDNGSQAAGLTIGEVAITGNRRVSELEVLETIGLAESRSLVAFDPEAARAQLAALPWVDHAAVLKAYPKIVRVELKEKVPYAIWQHGQDLALVDADGKVIAPYDGGEDRLPLVTGRGAPEAAVEFIRKVRDYPLVGSRAVAFIRVGQRRWDIRLDNGMTIKLPENEPLLALGEAEMLASAHGLLERDIIEADLRLSDRMTFRLGEAAAKGMADTVKAKVDAYKKLGKRT